MSTNYRQDIMDQPLALRETIAALEGDRRLAPAIDELLGAEPAVERIVLTGMGSSLHALHPLHLRLSGARRPSWLIETSELLHYSPALLDPGALVVAVSQSGQSAETVRLVDGWASRVPIIAVTNNPEGTLARAARAILLTRAGEEATVSSKTYLASLAALAWLGDVILAGTAPWFPRLAPVPDVLSGYLSSAAHHRDQLSRELEGIRHLFLVGRGLSLAAARTGALILKESTRAPAEGMSSAAFRHGPFEMVSRQGMVVVFEGEGETGGLNRALSRDISAAGGRSLVVGESASREACRLPPCHAAALPFLEFLPVQMMSLALAALGGFEPGRFERAGKVTTVE